MIIKNGKRIDGCSDTVPVGTLNPFLGSTAPYGYLICQGQKVSKTVYKELYEICGDTFGKSTDTEFYLPDLRGQTIAGYKEGDSTFGTLGGLIGSLTHTHTYAHTHGVPGVAHTHSYAHTHGVPGVAHTHTSAAHTHTINGHTHTSAAHTHSINGHTHTTGNHTLTIAELPAHNHTFAFNFYNYQQNGYGYNGQVYKTSSSLQTGNVTTNNTGSGGAHNHGNTGSTSLTTNSTTPGATGSTSLTTNSTTPGATGSTTPGDATTKSQSTSTSGSTTPGDATTKSQSSTNTSSVSNVQPTMALNWIVKAFQLMPNQSYVSTIKQDSDTNTYSCSYINDTIPDTQDLGDIIVDDITCKNIFDKNNFNKLNSYIASTTGLITADASNRLLYVECKPNTTYTIQKLSSTVFGVAYTNEVPTNGVQAYGFKNGGSSTELTITTGSEAKYIVFRYYHTINDTTYTEQQILDSIQIEKGSVATSYVEHREFDNAIVQASINALASKLNVITKNTGSTYTVTFNGALTGRYIFMYMAILNGGYGVGGMFTMNGGAMVNHSQFFTNSTAGSITITPSTTGFTIQFARNYTSCTIISPNVVLT